MPPAQSAPRILFVITKAFWGGAQRYVYDMAVAAQERGYEVKVVYGSEGLLRTKLEEAGIMTVALPTLMRDVNMKAEWESFTALRTLIREFRPDILHVNSSKAGLALLAGRIERVSNIIFTAHGWAFNEKRPWWQKMLIRIVYAGTIYLAHTTICVSDAVRRDVGWLPGVSLKTVKHGIDAPDFLPKESARTQLVPGKTDGTWFGMIAELHPTKRVQDAIDAIAELIPSYPDLRLVVMGGGELHEWLTARIQHYGLQDRIHLPGFVVDAPVYLQAFDFFLMPSRTEALGLALIEAAYAKLPVVAARAGGIPEIVQHRKTGLLVPAENPHALSRAIRLLLENPDTAATYAEALLKETKEKFSKERMLTETFVLYQK